MISSSDDYKKAIVGDARRMLIQAVIDITSPDIVFGTVDSSGRASFALPDQLHDRVMELTPYATLERGRWLLDGAFNLIPDTNAQITGQIGDVSSVLSGDDGVFPSSVWIEEKFSNVAILQACSIFFPTADYDGYPTDFIVEIKQGGTTYHTQEFEGNSETSIYLTGFTVYNPDLIRVTVTKWSLPGRRVRTVEIIPGLYENWNGNVIAECAIKHQGDISCMTLPYGTCNIKMDNLNRRFEPRNKTGVFQSIEERQGVDVSLGVVLEDGTTEYKRTGVFYQHSGGWKTGNNGLTMQWDMVDIVGLLANREFIPPEVLPTTLEGWIAALVAQIGENFADKYTVDPDYKDLPVTILEPDDVSGEKCGDILRYVCMATGTWPRADAETGYLTAEPLWSEGNKITLDNLVDYPTMKANSDIAAIIFTLNDGNKTQYVVSGNSTTSSETKSVKNPFIHTKEAALQAARLILDCYGGNQFEIVGRGDPSSEIGDVDTVWLDKSSATTARRIQQNLSLSGGVLKNCSSTLLQSDGSYLFQNREVITTAGTWTAPAGASVLRVILVGKGKDGKNGENGSWDAEGKDGQDGLGGKVWAGTININDQQQFVVSFDGYASIFGSYSSENGKVFSYGYTDIASGDSFARSGVESPIPGSGDGGKGGKGGVKGNNHKEKITDEETGESSTITVIDNYPGTGNPGVPGVSGCIVVYWDKVSE